MSRIGNRILAIPSGVEVTVDGNKVTTKGPKGTLEFNFKNENVNVIIEDGKVVTTRNNDLKVSKQLHGTTNSIIKNMLIGVSEGFKRELEINGVGYRFQVQGNKVIVSAGYSHPVELVIPEGLKVEMPEKILKQKNIFFVPDNNLGRYTARQLPEKNFIFNDGFCHVHKSIEAPLVQEAKSKSIIPLEKPAEEKRRNVQTSYEPSPEKLFDIIMPQYIAGVLYGSIANSFASEQASRRTAMENASDNADEMINDLSLLYNRARQAAITQEITEIVSGANSQE